MEKKFDWYVVVVWYGGIPYMLQMRNVLNWYFDNNHIKLYKGLGSAVRIAHKLSARYKHESVKVYGIYADDNIGGDYFRRCEREQRDRIMFEID
jgi:hypothetical protein